MSQMPRIKSTLFITFIILITACLKAQNPVLNFKTAGINSFSRSTLLRELDNSEMVLSVNSLLNETGQNYYQLTCSDSFALEILETELKADEEILWVEKNYLLSVCDTELPNDSLLSNQWYWFRTGADWMFLNRDNYGNSRKVVVAVIDTGIDFEHPDFYGQFNVNEKEDLNGNGIPDEGDVNGIDDDGNGTIDDVIGYDFTDAPDLPAAGDYLSDDPFPNDEYGTVGHGTPVAGIVAAASDNSEGIAGISSVARLMILRAGNSAGYLQVDDVVKAIFYAVKNGAEIINMSFGDSYPSKFLYEAIKFAYDEGTVLVAAAGNYGNDVPLYPAAWPEVLGIASFNVNNEKSSFSSFGDWISFAMPGEGMVSTAVNGGYAALNGTSFAAPAATAVISYVLAFDEVLSGYGSGVMYSYLQNSARNFYNAPFNEIFGYGVLKLPDILSGQTMQVEINYPAYNDVIQFRNFPLVATVWGENVKQYDFFLKSGGETVWTSATFNTAVYKDTVDYIDVTDLPRDSLLTLYLRVFTFANEQFIKTASFRITDKLPQVNDFTEMFWWNGGNGENLYIFNTDDECSASLNLYDTSEQYRFSRSNGSVSKQHYFSPAESAGAKINFTVTNKAGYSVDFPQDSLIDLTREQYNLYSPPVEDHYSADFTAFIYDSLTDFNRNGLPELVFSRSNADTVYGQLTVAEIVKNGTQYVWNVLAATDELFIPKGIGDMNGDGKEEILAGYGANSYILADIDGDDLPLEVVWADSADNWATSLVDLDNNGIYEAIVRKNGIYRIWQWDTDFVHTELYSFDLPGNSLPLYSKPRVIFADLEGDGQSEILFADYEGDLFIFDQVASFDFSFRQKISTGYRSITDYMEVWDSDGNGADELYFLHSVIPDLQSDDLMEFAYWQLKKMELFDLNLTVNTVANFKGVSLSNHFLKGLGRAGSELVVSLSPVQYRLRTGNGELFLCSYESNVNINKIIKFSLNGDSLYISGNGGVLTLNRFSVSADDNYLSENNFYQQNDTLLVADWKWKNAGNDSVLVTLFANSEEVLSELRTGDGSMEIGVDSSCMGMEYVVDFSVIRGGDTVQNVSKSLICHHRPFIMLDKVPGSETLLRLSVSENIDVTTLKEENFRLLSSGYIASNFNVSNGNSEILLLFDNVRTVADTLEIKGFYDDKGYLINQRIPIDLTEPPASLFYPLQAVLRNRDDIVIMFNKPVAFVGLEDSVLISVEPGVPIMDIYRSEEIQEEMHIKISPENVLGGFGSRGVVTLAGIRGDDGSVMADGGKICLPLANNIENMSNTVIYPNPLLLSKHEKLTIAPLPLNTRIKILTVNGELIYTDTEKEGNGALTVDINKQLPELVSGVYIVVLSSGNETKVKKIFVIK